MAKSDLISGSIWDEYSNEVVRRMNNPQNKGEITEERAKELGAKLIIADFGAESCGDAVRLYWAVDESTDKIVEAKFLSFGCFTSNTWVNTPTKRVQIKDLKVGDKVITWNGLEITENTIEEIRTTLMEKEELQKTTFIKENGKEFSLISSKKHPYWNVKNELQLAEDLKVGDELFEITEEMLQMRPEMKSDGIKVGDKVAGKVLLGKYSKYMQQFPQDLRDKIAESGVRFSHHSSIAPTGTISLSLANNASNGIEPSFAHHYSRNVIREGKKSKEKVDVFSYELLAYRTLINSKAMPFSDKDDEKLPEYFIDSSTIKTKNHVDIQAAAQKWIDSSISKTINVPTDYDFEEFKEIYMYAYDKGLKGCTTFRFNPEAFQGVLVTEKDLENTTYQFTLDDGSTMELKGNEEVEYDGETHTAANLYDALKEGYYGKF